MPNVKKRLTEAELEAERRAIAAAQANPRHFGVLYNQYYEVIFRFLYARTVNEALSGDLCAQVFMKALQNLPKFTYRGVPFSAWLFRIASNELAQYYRREKKQRVVTLDTGALHFLEVEEDTGAQDKTTLEHRLHTLKEVIQTLKENEVQLLELRFFEQRAFKEVADILGITENNAKVRTYRLLQKIKKRMTRQSKTNGL